MGEKNNINVKIENHGVIPKEEEHATPEELYSRLIDKIKRYHPSAGDLSAIDKAYNFAKKSHGDQKRKSGEPYIIHPIHTALILADLELDKESIMAGLLHDVMEDTKVTREQMISEFGEEVTDLVDGVTKLTKLDYDADKVEKQAENLRKMFLAMAKDIRVILIKLADRLHNMRTLQYMTPEKQKEKSKETMEIYAPIADRLGISKIKIELDDLALRYLEPFLVMAVLSAENSPDSLIYGFTPANLINFPAFEYLLISPSSAKIEVPVIIDIPGIDVIEESCVMASSSIFLSNTSI